MDMAESRRTLLDAAREIRACADAWEPDARLIGNVRAGDIVALIDTVLAADAVGVLGLHSAHLGPTGPKLHWTNKLRALGELGEHAIGYIQTGHWYVSSTKEIAGDGTRHSLRGSGDTPQAAVEDDWRLHVEELAPHLYIITATGRRVRWNGSGWQDVTP